jgi:hypothetical protein
LDRIKSVEFDLEKTKRVFIIHLCLLIILIWWCGFKICVIFCRCYMLRWWSSLKLLIYWRTCSSQSVE